MISKLSPSKRILFIVVSGYLTFQTNFPKIIPPFRRFF